MSTTDAVRQPDFDISDNLPALLERLGLGLATIGGEGGPSAQQVDDAIGWLVDHGAPAPRLFSEVVGYPGGSYTNFLAEFRRNDDTLTVAIALMARNPIVTLVELRVRKIAPGDPREPLVYVPKRLSHLVVPAPVRVAHPSGDTEGILGEKWYDSKGQGAVDDDVYFPGPNDIFAPGTAYTPVPTGPAWVKRGPSNPFDRPAWHPARNDKGDKV